MEATGVKSVTVVPMHCSTMSAVSSEPFDTLPSMKEKLAGKKYKRPDLTCTRASVPSLVNFILIAHGLSHE